MCTLQISVAIIIFYETVWGDESENTYVFAKMPDSIWIVFARFACGTVLHFKLQAEL